MPSDDLITQLERSLAARSQGLDGEPCTALRLFAGFYEGCPALIADLYARTLVLYDYAESPLAGEINLRQAQDFYLSQIPAIACVVQKSRNAVDHQKRCGLVTYGEAPAQQIREHEVIYAVDLRMNQDASFYLDTRNLRGWLLANSRGWEVLNSFAYTGSLGIAALAGGAARLIQTDRSQKFLALARRSAVQNRLDLGRMKLRGTDFFSEVARLKREGTLFDCVILDPPFFSSTSKGTFDWVNESTRLINKLRPLVREGGYLITVNNSLFLSGSAYLQSLERLCSDGYLSISEIIPIPDDVTGYPETIVERPPTDPAPFNHATKIVILRVKRKS